MGPYGYIVKDILRRVWAHARAISRDQCVSSWAHCSAALPSAVGPFGVFGTITDEFLVVIVRGFETHTGFGKGKLGYRHGWVFVNPLCTLTPGTGRGLPAMLTAGFLINIVGPPSLQ